MLTEWQRLEQIIKWVGMSVNSFGREIGLSRSENLYQIKRRHNGISRDLAEKICKRYPQISKAWVLAGEGDMMLDVLINEDGSLTYYCMSMLETDAVGDTLHLPLCLDVALAGLSPQEAGAGTGTYGLFRDLAAPFGVPTMPSDATFGISRRFQRFSPPSGQVAHVFLALPPLSPLGIATSRIPFDLHA